MYWLPLVLCLWVVVSDAFKMPWGFLFSRFFFMYLVLTCRHSLECAFLTLIYSGSILGSLGDHMEYQGSNSSSGWLKECKWMILLQSFFPDSWGLNIKQKNSLKLIVFVANYDWVACLSHIHKLNKLSNSRNVFTSPKYTNYKVKKNHLWGKEIFLRARAHTCFAYRCPRFNL